MNTLHIEQVLLADGWANDVRIIMDDLGNIDSIEPGIKGASPGCLLPGIANLHSHAHQRAMAGLTERAGDSEDSFWTWREAMYGFLGQITPVHLHAIASQLYVEMLKAGYTRVAEFQYLHHQPNGACYNNAAEMSLQIMSAANDTGIGLTNLPVLYQYGGFGAQASSGQQCRFLNEPEQFLRIVETLRDQSRGNIDNVIGVAAHSLRAVTAASFKQVLSSLNEPLPIHIHIAEQVKEVEDCIVWSGARPLEYLYDHFSVDPNWCLIHATHMTHNEINLVAKSGAVVGLCPTTEANLGDGFFAASDYLHAGGALGIGSDSNISVSPAEEIRWLEYGQRLLHGTRNQLSGGNNGSTGRHLLDLSVAGGAQACGHNSGMIAVGKRADFIVLDSDHPRLSERKEDEIIDSWIFSGIQNSVRDVYVGGKQLIKEGHHVNEDVIASRFKATLHALRAK